MTEVLAPDGQTRRPSRFCGACIAVVLAAGQVLAPGQVAETAVSSRSAEQLYLQLRSVGLDANKVYEIREAALDYNQVHITLEHGTIAFTSDVYGKVTGGFFEGEGEVLVIPADQAERASMSLFTHAAILEDRFQTAYLRFNDDTFATLKGYTRAPEDGQQFVTNWSETARNLAAGDALRLFLSFSRCLPVGQQALEPAQCDIPVSDRFLHARIQSANLGIYDLTFDASASEQISIGQQKRNDNFDFYNVWAQFRVNNSQPRKTAADDEIAIRSYKIDAQVTPPTELQATARMDVDILRGGSRALLFELSRFLKIKEVQMGSRPLEIIQNQALEGTQLARRGNDVVAVVFPEALQAGQKLELVFTYGGDVLSEAGSGLLYVGARGIWYPNRGMAAALFDLRFRYPAGWTLLATGKRVSTTESPDSAVEQNLGEQSSRWVSDGVIPVAGFNLGKYSRADARADDVVVETYAAAGVERSFPKPPEEVVLVPRVPPPLPQPPQAAVVLRPPPSPARNAQVVADTAARAVTFFAKQFGPFPYPALRLTQMPGPLSQGWPGLIFLSSYSFLTPEEKAHLLRDPVEAALAAQVTAHETAHQWWGDLVFWRGYRDQWFFEGLANYCSLVMLQAQDPLTFQRTMNRYRENLLQKNKTGATLKDAGPVTLGLRLSSSEFPEGYEAISYGRGTWLFHMLRHILDDGATAVGGTAGSHNDLPFVRGLRKLRERYAAKPVTTLQALDVLAEELPASARYEGRKNLDWFYEGWINGTAIPHFELQGVKVSAKDRSLVATGTILQKNAPKDLVTSLPLYARLAGNRRVFVTRVFADGPETAFRISVPAGTRELLIDPEQTVLKN